MSRRSKAASDRLILIRAKSLLNQRAHVLADFEVQVIDQAHQRAVRNGGVATTAEMAVVEDALAAMIAAGRQDLTDKGLAA